nr:hypothetical protein [Corynebacterium aquatimens]
MRCGAGGCEDCCGLLGAGALFSGAGSNVTVPGSRTSRVGVGRSGTVSCTVVVLTCVSTVVVCVVSVVAVVGGVGVVVVVERG